MIKLLLHRGPMIQQKNHFFLVSSIFFQSGALGGPRSFPWRPSRAGPEDKRGAFPARKEASEDRSANRSPKTPARLRPALPRGGPPDFASPAPQPGRRPRESDGQLPIVDVNLHLAVQQAVERRVFGHFARTNSKNRSSKCPRRMPGRSKRASRNSTNRFSEGVGSKNCASAVCAALRNHGSSSPNPSSST